LKSESRKVSVMGYQWQSSILKLREEAGMRGQPLTEGKGVKRGT